MQQQLLIQAVTDQTAEGNEEKLITEEKLLQVKRRCGHYLHKIIDTILSITTVWLL